MPDAVVGHHLSRQYLLRLQQSFLILKRIPQVRDDFCNFLDLDFRLHFDLVVDLHDGLDEAGTNLVVGQQRRADLLQVATTSLE